MLVTHAIEPICKPVKQDFLSASSTFSPFQIATANTTAAEIPIDVPASRMPLAAS